MRFLVTFLGILAVASGLAPAAHGAEVRTYRFLVDGSLPYSASCGECGGGLIGARADIEGTLTVTLDPEAGTGSLTALDNRLVNFFDVLASATGPVLEPTGAFPNSGIIPSYDTFYALPLAGMLTHNGAALTLASSTAPSPINAGFILEPLFSITITGDHAAFSMHLPIIDYEVTVSNASAVQVIPEPGVATLTFESTPILMSLGGASLRRRRPELPESFQTD